MATRNSRTRPKTQRTKRAELKRQFIASYLAAPPHLRRVIGTAVVMVHRDVLVDLAKTIPFSRADMWDDAPEDRR